MVLCDAVVDAVGIREYLPVPAVYIYPLGDDVSAVGKERRKDKRRPAIDKRTPTHWPVSFVIKLGALDDDESIEVIS